MKDDERDQIVGIDVRGVGNKGSFKSQQGCTPTPCPTSTPGR